MVDFFKNILVGAAILIHSIGHIVGIKSDLPKFNHPPPSPIIITSPIPSSSPTPKVNNNQFDNSNSNANNIQGVATHDGTRTGNIIKYKEWCNGNQEISVYENELITKKSSDGNTYTFTQGDWDCYETSLKDATPKILSPSSIPNQTSIPTPSIDPGKTAEMRNLIAEAKRLAAIRANALVTLNWYQENQPHCSRPIYVEGTNTPFSPDQSEQIYQSCLAITQPSINQYSNIIADANSKLRDVAYRLNILEAECPKCWEEAKK